MKILVVWYDIFGYANSIAAAFRTNGIDSSAYLIKPFKQYNRCKNIVSKLGIKYFKKEYSRKIREEIIHKCEQDQYTHILILNGNYTDILETSFFTWAHKNNISLILWFVDSARNYKVYTKDYFDNYKKIYSFEPLDLEHLKNEYDVQDVQYLPLGADGEIYYDNSDCKKLYDICFVGSGTKKRNVILEFAAKFCKANNKKMIVYGQFWRFRPIIHQLRSKYKLKRQYPNLYDVVVNKLLTPMEVAELYRTSRICLNIVQNVHSAANPRTFEILATKGFQLVDHNPAIEKLLTDRQHLAIYKDNKELEELLKYYLENDVERDYIAQTGLCEVQNRFLMSKLVSKIVEDIKQ